MNGSFMGRDQQVLRRPTLTALVVTFNRVNFLRGALQSILTQSVLPDEIVVLDNNSEDETADMVRREFPHVKLISSPRNLGCPAGRNYGSTLCRSDYILFVDDDGTLAPGSIAAVTERLRIDADLAVVAGVCLDKYHPPIETLSEGPTFTYSGGVCAIKRTVFHELGGYHEDGLRQGEESEFSFRLFDAGHKAYLEKGFVLNHHVVTSAARDRLVLRSATRQAVLSALRLVPGPILVPWLAWKLMAHFKVSLGLRMPTSFLFGLTDAVIATPRVVRDRAPVSYAAAFASTRLFRFVNHLRR